MLVYDITQEQTYSNVSKWLRNIEEVSAILCMNSISRRYTVSLLPQNAVDDVKLVLVGNKLDLEQHRQVTIHKGEKVRHCLW